MPRRTETCLVTHTWTLGTTSTTIVTSNNALQGLSKLFKDDRAELVAVSLTRSAGLISGFELYGQAGSDEVLRRFFDANVNQITLEFSQPKKPDALQKIIINGDSNVADTTLNLWFEVEVEG